MLNLKASASFASPAAALVVLLASPALAQTLELTGTPALTGVASEVTGILSVEEAGPLARSLELALAEMSVYGAGCSPASSTSQIAWNTCIA